MLIIVGVTALIAVPVLAGDSQQVDQWATLLVVRGLRLFRLLRALRRETCSEPLGPLIPSISALGVIFLTGAAALGLSGPLVFQARKARLRVVATRGNLRECLCASSSCKFFALA